MAKIVLVGAGSLQFGTSSLGDIFACSALDGAEIVLNDINLQAAEGMRAKAQSYIDEHQLKHRVSVAKTLASGLKGADFVLISIEVGDRFQLWDMDWQIPQQYGIQQIYGENGGPGGLFHSLRIIPPILAICATVMEVAPQAIVFNYSNPMSRICTTVKRKFPELRLIGMCHEIASLERHLPAMLGHERSNISYRAAGLNHFSVLTEVNYVDSGQDAYPDVRALAPGYFAQLPGYSEIYQASRQAGAIVSTEGWMDVDLSHIKQIRPWSDRWLFKHILEQFQLLPITVDSHFGEYLPWAHSVADHRGILDFYTYYRHFLAHAETRIVAEQHERATSIMAGILTGSSYEEPAVNITNQGYIADLPDWLVVEVPAMVSRAGVQGIKVDIPVGMRALLSNQVGIHNLTAEAVLQQSRELAIQALMADPTVSADVSKMPELLDHMIAEQSPWLDYLN